jgi:hypothetical protein
MFMYVAGCFNQKIKKREVVAREFLQSSPVGTPCLGAGTYTLGYSTAK